jgi:transcription elongation factor GreB
MNETYDNSRRLCERRRLAVLGAHLEAAEIVEPAPAPGRVAFGTVVQVEGDREARYAIVGVDEVDVARGRISWLSPIARALVGRKVGDEVTLTTPRGEETLEVVAIEIEPLDP